MPAPAPPLLHFRAGNLRVLSAHLQDELAHQAQDTLFSSESYAAGAGGDMHTAFSDGPFALAAKASAASLGGAPSSSPDLARCQMNKGIAKRAP